MTSNDVWKCLRIEATSDQVLIRKTYVQLIRQYRPDSHPAEFASIRSAYEEALRIVREQPETNEPDPAIRSVNVFFDTTASAQPIATTRVEPYDWNLEVERNRLSRAMDSQDDVAAIAWLDEYLSKARQGTFDAMQDFEAVLSTALLAHDAPPPLFVEACASQLKWPTRWKTLATLLGDQACVRLRGLLQLAMQHRFSKNFAANAWQRHLFSDASSPLPKIGWTPLLVRAHKVADDWRQHCVNLGFSGYLRLFNPFALRHLSGNTVQSCDIRNACLLALYALLIGYKAPESPLPAWMVVLLGLAVFFIAAGFRLLWRKIRLHFQLELALSWFRKLGVALVVLFFICMFAQRELAAVTWLDGPANVLKGIYFSYFGILLLWTHWWLVRVYDSEAGIFKLRKIERADDVWWETENREINSASTLHDHQYQ